MPQGLKIRDLELAPPPPLTTNNQNSTGFSLKLPENNPATKEDDQTPFSPNFTLPVWQTRNGEEKKKQLLK